MNPDFDTLNFDMEIEVGFFEDLRYEDVAPLLDELSKAGAYRVRGLRTAWSGPAAGGPEVGMFLMAVASAGAAAFLASFCSELGKDAYKAVRAEVIALAKRLRNKRPEERRAIVPLVIVVGNVRICVGRMLTEDPAPDEWTDAWLVQRLARAQEIVDRELGVNRPPGPGEYEPLDDPCRYSVE